VIVDCALYRDGQRQNEGPMALGEAAELCLQDKGFVWLGLFEPDEAELTDVQERFGLHDLAVEDAQNFHLRPKIEGYQDGGVLFVVLRTPRSVDTLEVGDADRVAFVAACLAHPGTLKGVRRWSFARCRCASRAAS
jgi:magnesium transporter